MIIFLYGEDTYRSSQKLHEITNKFKMEVDESGMNLAILDGANLKFEEFNQQVNASAFMSRKRMIVIKNLISSNKSKNIQKEILVLLKNKSNDNIIVFWEPGTLPKEKDKKQLWLKLTKEKFAQEFKPLTSIQINQWIATEIKKQNDSFRKNK